MGFMLIDLPEGLHNVRMRFETPLENRLGQVVLVITLVIVAGLALQPRFSKPQNFGA
jgi:hypothetical protein